MTQVPINTFKNNIDNTKHTNNRHMYFQKKKSKRKKKLHIFKNKKKKKYVKDGQRFMLILMTSFIIGIICMTYVIYCMHHIIEPNLNRRALTTKGCLQHWGSGGSHQASCNDFSLF